MANVPERLYVVEVAGDSVMEFACGSIPNAQIKTARRLAKENGRDAVESGAVCYFWADVMSDGTLQIGAFDEDLFEED